MIYERTGMRYMEFVHPAMFDEIKTGGTRGGVSTRCLNYVVNGNWLRE